MGIENNTREIEAQNQELQRANRVQIEQANKEHEELGKVLDGVDTLDNEAELDEISGNEDISEQDDVASQLDNNDKIEDETSEQFETINNPVYNEVENNGFSINDVNQAVDAKEAYEAEIRDMSQDEYHDQKELDQRVEENGSEPNMTEPSVLGNDLHQGDVSNKETDNRSRLNEPEQNPDASFKKDEADTVNLNEIRSKFNSEDFAVEKSYDVRASKETIEEDKVQKKLENTDSKIDIEAGEIGTPKTWEEFKTDPKNQIRYESLQKAKEGYQRVVENESPWNDGEKPEFKELEIGTRFEMAMAPGQPDDRPGAFGTMSNIEDKNFVRDKLAVKEDWKPEIDRVNTYEIVKPLPANVGEVGPQVDIPADRYLKGGSDQIEMLVEPRDRMDYIKLIDSRRIEE
ncbi:hypothetical protein [Holdemanella sp.]|uniref:hypothetical protein n=1 Tax=Holdemanella sp. TaxID=1971762 RepID=UPI0030805470